MMQIMLLGYGAGEGSVTTAEGLPASAVFYATGEDFNDRGPTLYPITKVGSSFTAGYQLPFSGNNFSGGSTSFDGVDDHINNSSSDSDIAFDTGDFTLECWVYFQSSDANLDTIVDTRSSTSASDGFLIGRFQTAGHEDKIELYTDGNYRITADVTVSDDTWTHVAVVRSSSVTTVYVDGTAYSSTYSDSNDYSNEDYVIGENVDGSYQFHGQIFDYRMVKGTAVYTSNFVPPLTLLTEIPNAKVLLCRSNINPLANIVSPGGLSVSGAVASWNNPFSANFGALADDSFNFEGTDTEQYFYAGTNTFLDDSLSSWQFQCWAYYENISGQAGNSSGDMGILVDQYEAGASGRLLFGFQGDLLVMRVNGGTVELTSGTLNKQVWYHVMLNWDGTTHRLFVNGSLVDSTTSSPSIYTGKRTEFGGGGDLAPGYDLHGYMKHVLVEQGGTVETSNFTPKSTFGSDSSGGGGGGAVFEMMFTEPGTYDFVPPSGVTSVNVVAVGGGGGCAHYPNSVTGTTGGGGGSLSYKNNISVSSSNTYTVTVGVRGTGASTVTGYTYPEGYQTSASSSAGDGGTSQFALGGTIYCKSVGGAGASVGNGGAGGNSSSNIGDGGGSGGDGGDNAGTHAYWAHGGGAGGYSGDGGHGGRWEAGGVHTNGATAGGTNSGAAGGGAGWTNINGVGIFGKGTTGAIGDPGSGGIQHLTGRTNGPQYGKYGGGGSGHGSGSPASSNIGQSGAVRIVWYSGSSFPSTSVDAPAGLTDEQLRTKGTAIGNMTSNGGLSAAFDGTTTGDYQDSARLDPSTGAWIGKDFGENVSIRQVVITRPDGDGTSGSNCFPGSGNGSATPMYLEHSHDGTTWQEAISSDNTSNKDLTINIGVNIVARYWRVRFTGDGNGGSVRECVFKSS